MATPNLFFYYWFTLTLVYYGTSFVWFGVGVLNYIPDPVYGFAWVLVALSPFQFFGPTILGVDFFFYTVGIVELHELTKYYLIFLGFLKFIKGYVIYSGLFLFCRVFGQGCQFIPSDQVPDDPTRSTVWIVLYSWEMTETIVIVLEGILYSLIPYYANQSIKAQVRDYLVNKYGDDIDFAVCADMIVDGYDPRGPQKTPPPSAKRFKTAPMNRTPPPKTNPTTLIYRANRRKRGVLDD